MSMRVRQTERRIAWAQFALICAALSFAQSAWSADDSAYRSPYTLQFSFSERDLIGDILDGKRGEAHAESSVAFDAWTAAETRKKWGSWGPPARNFAPPDSAQSLAGKSAQWKRERVIATALRYAGLHYQHHHIPDFDPPADWPNNAEEKTPHPKSKGLDCSNFTSWVYNLALGIKFNADIHKQSELNEATGPGAGVVTKMVRIERPENYDDFPTVLRPGDLLVIRSRKDEVSHVVLWIGYEKSGEKSGDPKSVPLILDSTGEGHRDKNGVPIPDGIQLRPFRRDSWYFHSASHALRVIQDDPAP